MEISLKGKQALIGGSSKGIGLAIAKQLASSGASVCLMARNKSKMKEIIKNLPSDKGQVHHFLQVDFSDFNSFKVKLDVFFKENKIDILVTSAIVPTEKSLDSSIDFELSISF